MSFETLPLHLDSMLDRELSLGNGRVRVVGTSSPIGLAMSLLHSNSSKINKLPHVVVVPRLSDAWRIQQVLQFFDSTQTSTVLPHFDVSPYIGLEPKASVAAERIGFLYKVRQAKAKQIFIVPIQGLLQKTLPIDVLELFSLTVKKGVDLPSDLNQFLQQIGYSSAPLVEDVGQYALRGGILDIFSPSLSDPVRIELFGDSVESIRTFSVVDQRSKEEIGQFDLIPAQEIVWQDDRLDQALDSLRKSWIDRAVDQSECEETLRGLSRQQRVSGFDFLLPYFYERLSSPLEYFSDQFHFWFLDPLEISRSADQTMEEVREDFNSSTRQVVRPDISDLFDKLEDLPYPSKATWIQFSNIDTDELHVDQEFSKVPYSTQNIIDLSNALATNTPGSDLWLQVVKQKMVSWKESGYRVFIGVKNKTQADRLKHFFERMDFRVEATDSSSEDWQTWAEHQAQSVQLIHLLPRVLPESQRIPEDRLIFLRDEDLLGKKVRLREASGSEEFHQTAKRLSFGDLKPGDCVVHVKHGIGVYEGLKIMNIGGADSEYVQIAYRDKDKLYLPVYRVGQLQKYSGAAATASLDKLGGPGWEKTKTKVRSHLRDLASELLKLYAERAEMQRPAFDAHLDAFEAFEAAFPYDETQDQERAINDFVKDMTQTKPMDRLICGDVGFGKTEVAMRAAFLAAKNGKQVAILAPTTVLTFQHLETFKKRFHGWPIQIRALNRFVSAAEAKKVLKEVALGQVDILIGTHRLLSKDVAFKDLGLLIVDEEQKFGVAHKERIRKLKSSVDTIAMSATPIPRTLNMSLMGVRDLSIINSAPVDRLPTRTFICKFDEETIRKAILSEMARGGQVYFIHNRVQSIYALADELKKIVPEARMRVGHGQMDEHELEETMLAFFQHEIDVLICTTIVESGMDIPKANTMFIDQAHMMGLSQLYQLRGRVGRSKQRAYCYLILPRDRKIDKEAQERLKVIQENTALGSGIRIAQYDLELRGAGNILGEDQSGHVNSVGYEMYMDLLNEAVHELKGDPIEDKELDPEINLRVPALIPDNYIGDIRIRLSYYKALADIRSHEDVEKFEEELKDQFGEPPEPVLNLMGLMLIRGLCRDLGVRDVSAGPKNISLVFTEKTKLKPETVIQLAMRENKKYSLTPDQRLNVRMNNITWPAVYEEISYLLKLI